MKIIRSLCLVILLCSSALAQSNLIELQTGWRMSAAATNDETAVSSPTFDDSKWYPIQRMPATVLQVLDDNGVYKDLYYGMNLTKPGDLWKQDWWYRTTFTAPAGQQVYSLIFKGINYRADIWLNGAKVADSSQALGMYNQLEFDVTKEIKPGAANVLAVKVTPERDLLTESGILVGDHPVELADSWLDWINWKYIGYHDPAHGINIPFVPDRNAGIWKRVFLSATGPVTVRNAYVATDLPLPALTPATLTVYCDLSNHTNKPVSGTLEGEITRPGKPTITVSKQVSLLADETKEAGFTPAEVAQLTVANPDLWWPYQWGPANLYHLKLNFTADGKSSDSQNIDFGVRKIVQRRDDDNSFPNIGSGAGNFYLQINGRDYLIRGAAYAPDLLFRTDPSRDAAHILYVKDLGLNLVRWELKIADDTMIERADREGIPVMLGWMCCMQWEHWNLWSAEDQWIARQSLRSRLRELRSHPSVVLWANGSDGLPPDPVLNDYHQIEKELHWQDAIVDTVAERNRFWSGIHMLGPYVWRPPYYWFSDKYGPARGSSAEEGDNETVPPLDSLRKYIPSDKLWPPNEFWFFHAGGNEGGNSTLANITRALDHRYGPSKTVEEFTKKAQVAYYEDVRAQYETYATHWSNRKMLMHWMMNPPWPSSFGHLYDYYFKQGGGYFGAKKGLRPRSVVWDYYAAGDRSTAHVYAVNLTPEPFSGKLSVSFYNVDGSRKYANEASVNVPPNSSADAMSIPRISGLTSTYFVRCQLTGKEGVVAENVYWQSTTDDDLGGPANDEQFTTNLTQWADLTALNTMPATKLDIRTSATEQGADRIIKATLTNRSNHIAFFVRVEVTGGPAGGEFLPITYDDNYITLFPHESRTITATLPSSALANSTPAVRVEGYNVPSSVTAVSSR